MKVSLFLGAGASAMFDRSTTAEFLKVLPQHLDKDIIPFYNHLMAKLQFKDVEDLLQALKDVRLFGKTDVGKLVLSGTSMTGLRYTQDDFLQPSAELERQIEMIVKSHYGWRHDHDQKLLNVYEPIFSSLRSQTGSVMIFTTNYDTVVETYCRLNNCACIDGFVGSSDLRRWDGNFDTRNADNHVCLYKLHGSLEWKLHEKYGIIMSPEMSTGLNIKKDLMIMPTRSPKEEEKATPFSEIFDLMKAEFQKQDACIVIGCSFRDEGVNEVFRKFIQDKKTMVAVSPTVVKDLKNLFGQECEATRGANSKLYIAPKEGSGCVLGFATKFESSNATNLISESLSAIQERHGDDPCYDT